MHVTNLPGNLSVATKFCREIILLYYRTKRYQDLYSLSSTEHQLYALPLHGFLMGCFDCEVHVYLVSVQADNNVEADTEGKYGINSVKIV